VADALTKALPRETHERHCGSMGIHIHNIPGVRMGGGVGTIASEHDSDHVTHIT
jgi:hypothetical protein